MKINGIDYDDNVVLEVKEDSELPTTDIEIENKNQKIKLGIKKSLVGGGGGVTIVPLEVLNNRARSTMTWQEIRDAAESSYVVFKVSEEGLLGSGVKFYPVYSVIVGALGNEYEVNCVDSENEHTKTFVTDSVDGYPIDDDLA